MRGTGDRDAGCGMRERLLIDTEITEATEDRQRRYRHEPRL